jgi:hypothetical protein
MQTLRRIVAVLIFPAIAYLGAACERMDTPTGASTMPVMQMYPSPNLIVDDDGMQCPTATFTTIQAAINFASPNQVILVCAGTYPELLTGTLNINKTLTLLGAQNTVDARTRGGLESVITDVNGTRVNASNVVIDGFTVQNSINPNETGYGIHLNPGVSGTKILNNIIQNNIVGIGLANTGPSQAVIRRNLIRNNTQPGGASGSGIYTDQFVGGPTVTNVLIDSNAFVGHAGSGGAINISNSDFANGVFNLEVSSNLFDLNSRAFFLLNTHSSTFHDNTITNSTFLLSADVRLFDNNTNLLFTDNDLSNGVGHAIRFSVLFGGGPSSFVEFHQNNIENYALTGLTVDLNSHVGTVNATCNWWNSPSGPFNATENPTGTGEEVVGDADFTPWLNARAPGGSCIGGLVGFHGMVTGGGQIDLTGGGRGSFGFSAKDRTQSGHLDYMNHVTHAHLNCTVMSVTITPPNKATLSGPCSSKNAGGATSFTADVEDNGEPGKNGDTFKITYTTMDGSTTMPIRSGNIKIH